ncbi:MAG: hypothetical protein KC496_16880 [Anaerolineae bacterium]|nr:hypothetical protein [Anaerolineae bacterium]
MNQQPDYIQLQAGEDVPSVRDRLSFLRGRRVLLIWPERGTALSRKLDLVLVQREAKRRVIQLALVTHDENVIVHARELGISTFETIQQAERNRWKRGRSRVFVQRHHKPENHPEPEELMPVASRVRSPRKGLSGITATIVRVAVLAIVLGTLLGTLYIVVPSATVRIAVAQFPLEIETTLIADPAALDVDVENGIIPATVVSATVQTVEQIETTGTLQDESRRAIGVVTFTNQTTSALEIPADTTVSTSGGTPIEFATLESTTLPGGVGQRVDIRIEALQTSAGTQGNVAAGTINTVRGALANQVTVRNLTATTAGSQPTSPIVTEADQQRLRGIVRGRLQALAYTEMEANLTETQIIVIDTVNIPDDGIRDEIFSNEPGDISSTLTLDMRAVVQALVIDDRFARQVVFAKLSAEQPEAFSLRPDSFSYTRGLVLSTSESGQITFNAYGNGTATVTVDIPELQQRLAGTTVSQAVNILQSELALLPDTPPQIEIVPGFIGRLPLVPMRITIEQMGNDT